MRKFFLPALLALSACSAHNGRISSLEECFHRPDTMQTAVYWYWMNDNISKEGVINDLKAMKEVGINRAFIGNQSLNDELDFGDVKLFTPEWWDITRTALKTAGELGIDIGIFNCPGWSQSGGPWVTDDKSMRYLACSTMELEGPSGKKETVLPEVAENALEDVKILAFPAIEERTTAWKVTKKKMQPLSIDVDASGDGYKTLFVTVCEPALTYAMCQVWDAQNDVMLVEKNMTRAPNPSTGFIPYAPLVVSLTPDVKKYRVEFLENSDNDFEVEMTLSTKSYVEQYPQKSLAKMHPNPSPDWDSYMWKAQAEADGSQVIDPESIIDLTDMVEDGVLKWEVPQGKWTIMRFAMRTTGRKNEPASPEGTGLEIDKMSKEIAAWHFDQFIGEILRRIPAEDRPTFSTVVEDSYETGSENWTDDMAEVFENTYGYDPTPFLPALYGNIVGSQDLSDRFLWDLRRLVADRVAFEYIGGMQEISAKHGLTTWLETYGHWGFPSEFLLYGSLSDEVAGEFWSSGYLGDLENRDASSCAHIYGKKKVWSESCTSGTPPFTQYPRTMKQRIDRFFTEGINATLLHFMIEQPYEDKEPGMVATFGNEFNRKNTWFPHMGSFVSYLKRCNFLLQQGTYVADVAYFIGEDAPKMKGICDPALPKGHSFDFINSDVLMHRASVKDGKLTLPDGLSYSVLVLPPQETMRPEVARRIRELVVQGLTVIGPAPGRSPSLCDYPDADAEVREIASELWGEEKIRKVGKGYVFAGDQSLEDVFSFLGIEPDFADWSDPDSPVLFIHRSLRNGEIYFVSNQSDAPLKIDACFRTAGRRPQLWNPVDGSIRDLEEYSVKDGKTYIPLEFNEQESCFIIFDKKGRPARNPEPNFPARTLIQSLNGPWTVSFQKERGGLSEPLKTDTIGDWCLVEGLEHYSGLGTYKTSFTLDEIPQGQVFIQFADIMVTARVRLNGKEVGCLWTTPFRVNVTDALTLGENILEVEVANNWQNRMIGDAQLPEEDRLTWTNKQWWFGDESLQPSGLFGPVELFLL